MRSLVLIHEIHVYSVVGNLLIVLSRKLTQRLSQILQAVDIGLGGREGMCPRNDTCTFRVIICLVVGGLNDFACKQIRLYHDLKRNLV